MNIKCLIWDMDDTLWEGTLSEKTDAGLRQGAREVIEQLDKRGILQSIASRNDHDRAMLKLEHLSIREFFLYPQCSWDSKVESIKQIVEKLNIGMNSVAYIDDNPFELFEVSTYLPEIHAYSADEYRDILDYPEFQVDNVTQESSMRRKMMMSREQREKAAEAFTGSREEFLKECRMELLVRTGEIRDMDRIYELASRTSQMNNLLERPDEETIRKYLDEGDKEVLIAELNDRFGYHGIVGACLLDINMCRADVKLFCISCRVEGRGIGFAFLSTVINILQKRHDNIEAVYCGYKSEERNRPALFLLQMLGFKRAEKLDNYSVYMLKLPYKHNGLAWLKII